MPNQLKQILLLRGSVGRLGYFITGIVFFCIKFLIDSTIAQLFHQDWGLFNYIVWPTSGSFFINKLPWKERDFALLMLGVAIPFIWTGVAFTLARLRNAGLPLWLILPFFVPVVNLQLILALCVIPESRLKELPPLPFETALEAQTRRMHKKLAGESKSAAFVLAVIGSAGITAFLVWISASVLKSYGFGLFVGAPFGLGWLAAVLFGIPKKRSMAECQLVGFTSLALCGAVFLAFAFEGLICLIMAFPIASPLVCLGAIVGYAFQSRPWAQPSTAVLTIGLCTVLPGLMAAEAYLGPEPLLREVKTSVIVDAAPEVVWQYVIAFPPLPEPTELFFRSGIAYPKHAKIEGTGVGAIRHCVFSTGPFVEPITVWDAPNKLAFSVESQPEPMHELSPYDIHPPHLDNFLVSKKGQFILERLPDGTTRLEGTTWYTNKMWPELYWGFLADRIIGSIHRRVLNHVQSLSEHHTP